ncbi:biliverdin-producing heme oxygenase [Aeoliella sp. ICT_H6.2]|uniref:Biliverdin-producing heme oxygenase n=1 Tax=Aeoliella straminimaris TaxID=2954799 RepID=A0A9X2JH23_9BACT|nr:biliverdin-producing heme oxygenase [Aeoliella straminimaris]MCO6044173.1 biliverdin-producing heme oxygenase [Aeoliella straminimaris]
MPAQPKHHSVDPASTCAVTPSHTLRQATASAHHSVEQASSWTDIFASLDSYTAFLGRLRSLIAAAESAVEPHLAGAGPWVQVRRRSSWIEEDLRCLSGLEPSADKRHGDGYDFDWVTSPAQAAGVCYVLEGSALGGVHLARQAQQLLGLEAEGTRYLAGNGSQTAAVWKQVTDWLNRLLIEPKDQLSSQQAANATFAEYELVVRARD